MGIEGVHASSQRRHLIELKLTDAYHQAHGADSGDDLRKANEMLQEILEMMKDRSSRMLHEDHDACWQRWVEVKETLKYRRQEISNFNYGHFKNEAYQAKGWAESLPKDAKQKVQEVQRDMNGRTMERWQFDEIKGVLDEAWKIANSVLQSRHAEWERKQEEWQSRMSAAKSRKLELLEKNRSAIYNIQQQIDRCREMLHAARSSEHQYRVQGWIDEKYAKISDIERFNGELEDQIRSIDEKLK